MDHELHNHHGKPVSHVRPVKQESYDAPRLPTGTTSFHHHHSSYDNFDQSNWYDRGDPNGPSSSLSANQLSEYVHVWKHPNGGASVVQMDQNEFDHLSPSEVDQLADMFFREVFHEDSEGCTRHVIGVVRNAARYLPEMVSYCSEAHSDVVVKMGHLRQERRSEIETSTFSEFAERVRASYNGGTFRCGPLLQVSLVQPHSEESGKYCPDILGKLELRLNQASCVFRDNSIVCLDNLFVSIS